MGKKIILWICTIFVASLIFFFSAQQAPESAALSGSITEAVLEAIPSYSMLPPESQVTVLDGVQGFMRSLAHFSIFLFFGFFVIQLLLCYPVQRPYLLAISICIVYAITDELHQGLFSAGRACEFIDLVKDWSGSAIGIGVVILFRKIATSRKMRWTCCRSTPKKS